MPRFILIFIGAIFLIFTIWRIYKGEKLNVIDWVLLFISVVMVGSFVSYILLSN